MRAPRPPGSHRKTDRAFEGGRAYFADVAALSAQCRRRIGPANSEEVTRSQELSWLARDSGHHRDEQDSRVEPPESPRLRSGTGYTPACRSDVSIASWRGADADVVARTLPAGSGLRAGADDSRTWGAAFEMGTSHRTSGASCLPQLEVLGSYKFQRRQRPHAMDAWSIGLLNRQMIITFLALLLAQDVGEQKCYKGVFHFDMHCAAPLSLQRGSRAGHTDAPSKFNQY
ncbi:hypothetical protein C8R47DRAFT_1071492 [Mycena vitilis]|nr:hypothetical protein C8R47DRAFT_1071492 [Mycena vitilis]